MSTHMHTVWKISRFIVAASLLVWVLHKVHWSQVWGSFQNAKLLWLLFPLTYPLITLPLGVTRWRLFLRAFSAEIEWTHLCRASLVGLFFNNFSPADLGSDVYRTWRISRLSSRNNVLRSVICDRLCGWLSLVLLGLLAFPSLKISGSAPSMHYALLLLSGIGFSAMALLIGGAFLCRRRLASPVSSPWMRRIIEGLKAFETILKLRVLGWAALSSFAVHGVVVIAIVCLAKAYGVPNLRLWDVALMAPVVLAISMLPISIAGHGVRESAFVILLPLVGVSTEVSLAMSLSLFACIAISSLIGGVLLLSENLEARRCSLSAG